jgi:hypothetical protein
MGEYKSFKFQLSDREKRILEEEKKLQSGKIETKEDALFIINKVTKFDIFIGCLWIIVAVAGIFYIQPNSQSIEGYIPFNWTLIFIMGAILSLGGFFTKKRPNKINAWILSITWFISLFLILTTATGRIDPFTIFLPVLIALSHRRLIKAVNKLEEISIANTTSIL